MEFEAIYKQMLVTLFRTNIEPLSYGSAIKKYYMDVLNTTTGLLQVLSLTKDLRERVVNALNGNEYSLSMRAVNSIGNSESNQSATVIPFGMQTISNVVVSNKTISFDVKTNGRKVDDVLQNMCYH